MKAILIAAAAAASMLAATVLMTSDASVATEQAAMRTSISPTELTVQNKAVLPNIQADMF